MEEDKDDSMLPYIIEPEEYGDDILTDTYGVNVDDIVNTVGREFIDHFGDNPEEPDVVYVRNDRLEMDYQILQCNSGEED